MSADQGPGRVVGASVPAGARTARWRRPSGKALAATVATLASLTSVLAFVRETVHDEPPARKTADILGAELVGTHERLGDYLRDTGQPTQGLSREELAEEGISAQVSVLIAGKVGDRASLRWSLYTAEGERLRDAIYNQTAVEFTTEAQEHDAGVTVWSPYPPKAGRYQLRFALVDRRGTPLDGMSTPVFRIEEVPEI